MSEPFIAEIRIVGFNFAPVGWALCDGQLLPISQNTALFSLLGTTFGGNGQTTFALPDLRGRAPMFDGQGPGLPPRVLGERGGTESVTLTVAEMPPHSHPVAVSTAVADRANPVGTRFGSTVDPVYTAANPGLAAAAQGTAGGSQPHENMQPSLVLNFIIALQGIFPPRP
ncbi:MAG: tail fiber protein [Xanthomonadaceae bacterium]|jgi:microcystin-dependent protein|nr:tail fiber protein [Xanthomonadaceae bacterium]